jgi:hypothetical protein
MEISSFTDHILQYLHIIKCPVNPPLASCCPMFTYLENQLSCSWWRIPIHSWPWSADNCPTPYQFSHPLTPNPQIKLQCIHRRHQQHQSSSSGTRAVNSFRLQKLSGARIFSHYMCMEKTSGPLCCSTSRPLTQNKQDVFENNFLELYYYCY